MAAVVPRRDPTLAARRDNDEDEEEKAAETAGLPEEAAAGEPGSEGRSPSLPLRLVAVVLRVPRGESGSWSSATVFIRIGAVTEVDDDEDEDEEDSEGGTSWDTR